MIYSIQSQWKLADGAIVALPFNRSGVLNNAFVELARRLNIKITVISIDVQELDPNVTLLGGEHWECDWTVGLRRIKEKFGRVPDIVAANSSCTYNTYLCPLNFEGDGGALPGEEMERMAAKRKWTHVFYDCLTLENVPVILAENPMGFFDQVVKYKDGSYAFVQGHPWHYGVTEQDMHNKRTNWFSGGMKDAITEYCLTRYMTQSERPDNVESNWVFRMTNMNERSKVAPSMAMAIAKCSLDRFIFVKHMKLSEYVEFVFDKDMINPPPKKNKICGTPLANGMVCNMRENHHNSRRNHLRGKGLAHGVFDYVNSEYIQKETIVCSRTRARTAASTDETLMFESVNFNDAFDDNISEDIVENIMQDDVVHTTTTRVYKCSICKVPKKGHKCLRKTVPLPTNMKKKQIKNNKKVYMCSTCKLPKKGHKCLSQRSYAHVATIAKKRAYLCSVCKKPKKAHICKAIKI